jgi:hypothetical protein
MYVISIVCVMYLYSLFKLVPFIMFILNAIGMFVYVFSWLFSAYMYSTILIRLNMVSVVVVVSLNSVISEFVLCFAVMLRCICI